MTIGDKFYQDLLQFSSALEGNLATIKSLVKKFEVVNLKTTFHYDLIENAVIENVNIYKIMDVEVSGQNKSDIVSISEPLELLGLRLGKTFGDTLFELNRSEFLSKWYDKYTYKDFTYYLHKNSEINPELIESAYDCGFETFDKMMINSLFGQVYYVRD